MKVSFVIPVYNERGTLEELTEGILKHVEPHEPHILFIDDGSTDGSAGVLESLRERIPGVEVLRFRRNFGKSAALAAGFQRAEGDLVFTMDADLQDDPAEIPRFIQKAEEGFDIVVRVVAVIVVPRNRRPTAGMAWLLAIFFVPIFGILFFLLIGNPKLPKGRSIQ